jgi:hypothetical protein
MHLGKRQSLSSALKTTPKFQQNTNLQKIYIFLMSNPCFGKAGGQAPLMAVAVR